jgi:RNA polymerase sigma factor (sigma-70 family)
VQRPEAKYIEGMLKGDRAIMQEVYEMFRRKMFGICLRYSANREEAADFMHDGFLKVFTEFGKYKPGVPLEAWIATVIRNNTINQIRKAGRMQWVNLEQAPYEKDGSDDIEAGEQSNWMQTISTEQVFAYMSELPEKYRLILNMYAIDGMTHAEIADNTGMSEGTSKSQLSRARVKLIKIIRDDLQKKNEPVGKSKMLLKKVVEYEQIR